MEKTRYKAIASVISLLGLWLIVAGFITKLANANIYDNLIVGLIVASLGVVLGKVKTRQAWSCYVFGIWMIMAAFIPRFLLGSGHLWNNLVVGILIAIAGFTALGGELSRLKSVKLDPTGTFRSMRHL
jgi:hypothetical protein